MIWLLTCIVSVTPVTLWCDKVDVDKDTVFCIQEYTETDKNKNSVIRHKPIAMAPREKCLAVLKEKK